MRGAFLEAILRWSSRAAVAEIRHGSEARSQSAETPDGGAAPAGEVRTLALGRPWGPVRSYYEGLPSMAGRGCDEGGRKSAGSGSGSRSRLSPEARVQGQKSPQVERRMASAPRKRARRKADLKRHSALHPLTFSRGAPDRDEGQNDEGLSGAHQRIRRTKYSIHS
jgi:hypothetical protein